MMMTFDQAITLYDWISPVFEVSARQHRVRQLAPYLSQLVTSGHRVLDLCCGTGPFSFWFEERGASVTGIDISEGMIDRARRAATERHSQVEFIRGDVLEHDFGLARYDGAVLLGASISDFPLQSFSELARRVCTTLKQGGQFVIHYDDGGFRFIASDYPRVAVQQDGPPRITRRFERYLPDQGAYVETYTNEATGECCEYTSYIYTPPLVELVVSSVFDRVQHNPLGNAGYLDVFIPRS